MNNRAPEVLSGKQYNEKCDIWSLGVIIYQMLFGKPPFMPAKGGGIAGLAREIQKEIFTFPDDIPVSDEIKHLLKLMLTVDPQKRIDFKGLFQNKWITGDYGQYIKDNQEHQYNSEVDLTQSLKMKKEQAKEKQICLSKGQQSKVIFYHPKQIVEGDENAEDEELKQNTEFDEQDENEKEREYEDIEIHLTYEANDINATPKKNNTQLVIQDNLTLQTPTASPTLDQCHQDQDTHQKQKQKAIRAGTMKLALSLRKYYEKRIINFIANCKKFIDFYENAQQSVFYANNHFYRYSVFLNAIIITSRIQDFIKGTINIKIDSETYSLGSYSQFSALFLDNGENDVNNYTHILRKKLITFHQIVEKLQKTAQMPISTTNSPEFLFLQNLIKTYSLDKITSGDENQLIVKEIQGLLEIMEKLQLPSLQLQSQIRKQGIDTKKLFNEVKSLVDIIHEVVKNDKKYVKYQNDSFEIKISIVDIPQNEQNFHEIKKKLFSLLNIYHDSNPTSTFSSVNTDNNLL